MKIARIAIIGIMVIAALVVGAWYFAERAFYEPVQELAGATFLVKPYLQLGDVPKQKPQESLELLWQTPDIASTWQVDVRLPGSQDWRKLSAPQMRRVILPGILPRRMYEACLSNLIPGKPFEYRLLKDQAQVFQSHGLSRKNPDQSYRFAVFGDLAAGSEAQKKIAYQVFESSPDMVMLVGDIVYKYGRFGEYLEKFFPVYNAERAAPSAGAPLLRSVLFVAAPGNHDIGTAGLLPVHDLGRFPDGLAYFVLWCQPLNGPFVQVNDTDVPVLYGPEANRKAFLSAAGQNYPRLANFSFDCGNAHWTVLDGNDYINWNDERLRAWLDKDLESAKEATWRFVAYHQAAFSSDKGHHFDEQRMRLICDILQKHNVDMVFAGHVHNYQRTFPLTFSAQRQTRNQFIRLSGEVPGRTVSDKEFDGAVHNHPHGAIYVVTGGGGAGLSGARQEGNQSSWQPFTTKFIAHTHSFTLCEVQGKTMTVRQVSEDGTELDRFSVAK